MLVTYSLQTMIVGVFNIIQKHLSAPYYGLCYDKITYSCGIYVELDDSHGTPVGSAFMSEDIRQRKAFVPENVDAVVEQSPKFRSLLA